MHRSAVKSDNLGAAFYFPGAVRRTFSSPAVEVTRAKILNRNPFLRGITVEGLKNWANIKTEGLVTR